MDEDEMTRKGRVLLTEEENEVGDGEVGGNRREK
jgi:hypothetical protein